MPNSRDVTYMGGGGCMWLYVEPLLWLEMYVTQVPACRGHVHIFESRKQVQITSVIFVWGRCFPKEMIMESMKTQLPKVEDRRKRKILSKKIPEYDSSEMKLSS